MSLTVVVVVPGLRLKSLNVRENHFARARRVSEERLAVAAALSQVGPTLTDALRGAPRVLVRFTRIGGRPLDSDNCVGAFKGCRDEVAKWLRKSDAAGSGVDWAMPVAQEPGAGYAVRIELSTGGE